MDFIPQSRLIRCRHAVMGKADDPDIRRIRVFEANQETLIKDAFNRFLVDCKSEQVVSEFEKCYKANRLVQALAVTDEAVSDFSEVLEPVFINAGNFENAQLRKELDIKVTKIEVSPNIDISFDPGSADAARELRQSMLQFIREITESQREAIRAALARALKEGMGPADAARLFRQQIGLTRNQMRAVDNYRNMLTNGDSTALSRTLRDRRFDSTLERAIERNTKLTTQQIDRMTARYQERMLQMRAETIARTEMMDATNAARHQATIQMANKVDLEMGRIKRIWRSTMDLRTRDTHMAMNRQERGADEAFVSPSGAKIMYPGDRMAPAAERINCRCVLQTKILPPQESSAVVTTPAKKPRLPKAPPSIYTDLRAAQQDKFSDGFVEFGEDDIARQAFTQMNSQVASVLRNAEAAQIAEADKMLAAALKSAEALEVAAVKRAAKFVKPVRDAANARGITSTSVKDVGGQKVIQPSKFEYGVPVQDTKPPVGKGKAPDKYLRVNDAKNDLLEEARVLYRDGLKKPLTPEETLTVQRYTGSHYETINKADIDKRLRDPDVFSPGDNRAVRADEYIRDMDAIFKKTKIQKDVMVFRGMGADRWHRTFDGLQPGQTVIIDKAVLSTSLSKKFAGNWYLGPRGFVVEIMVPKGAKALSLETITVQKGEWEILLDRSSRFLVHSISQNKALLELLP